ncbi:MAG: hypothetical protein RR461_12025 [Angelakisella sp.]
MKEKPKPWEDEKRGYVAEFLEKPDNVASATEETGLMPTPPMSAAESDSYGDICDVPMQVNKIQKQKKDK